MQKPLLVAKEDFMISLTELINQSGLELCIVQPMIQQLNHELLQLIAKQTIEQRKAYEASLNAKDDGDDS